MIHKIRLLHYLTEETYRKIAERLQLDFQPSQIGENFIAFSDEPITKVQMFNIVYKDFGHVWFMYTALDFPRFSCTYDEFESRIYERYNALFGGEIMSDFPDYDNLNCDYIEYVNTLEVADAGAALDRLAASGCPPEQLDKTLWEQYEKAHGTIEFCLAAADGTHLETLARCHGTALKKRLPEKHAHRGTGITPLAAVNAEVESDILTWLRKKHGI
jgi:hypothetical protein